MPAQTFHRCQHCRGFYEAELGKCKWCSYETRFSDAAGKPMVYASREIARSIQLADYEQLPAKVRGGPMGPPPANLTIRCVCIHCGQEGHDFEAIEMRWIGNEHMWACPCTTCGGRGFQFDIHPVEPIWECAECKRWYKPQKFASKYAKCPYCGSPHANGWYDDEDERGEPVMDEDQGSFDAENLDDDDMAALENSAGHLPALPEGAVPDEDLPWSDDDPVMFTPHLSGEPPETPETATPTGPKSIPDDIDFPRTGIPEPEEWQELSEDNMDTDDEQEGSF